MAVEITNEIQLPRWLAREKDLPQTVVLVGVKARTEKAALVRLRYVVRPADHCHRCGLEITHPASLAVGYGPECCERIGLPRPDAVTAEELLAAAGRLAEEEREVWVPLFVIGEGPEPDEAEEPEDDPARFDLGEFVDRTFRETFARSLPGYEPRTPQLQMARLVARGLTEGHHVVAEAGTGTGKSLAYLVPAIGRAVDEGGKVVASTGTIALQEQLIGKDVPFLKQHLGLPFRAALAKGKGNYLCKQRLDDEQTQPAFALDDQSQAILRWAKETQTGDKADLPFVPNGAWDLVNADDSCTGRKCGYYDECFYYKAKKRLEEAHLVVCNHALFFADLKVRLASDGAAGVLPPASMVVFDEAHHIEQTAIEALGIQVSNARLGWLARRVRKSEWFQGMEQPDMKKVGDLLLRLEEENERVFGLAYGLKPDDEQAFRLPADVLDRLQAGRLLDSLTTLWALVEPAPDVEYSKLSESEAKRRKLANLVAGLQNDLITILKNQNRQVVSWAKIQERQGREAHVVLRATPISVADDLRKHLFNGGAKVVLTSATISAGGRFDYLRKRIGLDEALEMVVASPFDYWNQCELFIPSHLPEPNERGYTEVSIPLIEQLLRASSGRAFVLFTSYRAMQEAYNALAHRLPWRCLRQGDAPKGLLIDEFKRDVFSVLFATASFWEGVDVQGEALSLVIMDKLPFSVPSDPVAKARAEAVDARGGSSFMELSVPEAVIRFKQGFGRLIRSRSDRGVVAVLDKRLVTKRYGQIFLRSLPKVRVTDRLEDVRAFFGEEGRASA